MTKKYFSDETHNFDLILITDLCHLFTTIILRDEIMIKQLPRFTTHRFKLRSDIFPFPCLFHLFIYSTIYFYNISIISADLSLILNISSTI